ncbi:MAG: cyclophilin-like fold protein [bacterium]
MSENIEITTDDRTVTIELAPCSLTSQFIDELPFESRISTWGDEIYFPVPVEAETGSLTQDVSVGDVAFWHEGQSLAIFFGPTPKSDDGQPVPADDVEIVGEVTSGIDTLEDFRAGQSVTVKSGS